MLWDYYAIHTETENKTASFSLEVDSDSKAMRFGSVHAFILKAKSLVHWSYIW